MPSPFLFDHMTKTRTRNAGFTMVELIVVIVIVGIVAAVAVPKLIDRRAFESRDFYERAIAVVRQSQKVAIARRATGTPILLCVTASGISAGRGANCAILLPDAVTGGSMSFTAPTGVTLTPTGTYTFDGLGQPNAAIVINFASTIPGDPARQITVATPTGYVKHTP
jgi:MSHA pilin protein MshC